MYDQFLLAKSAGYDKSRVLLLDNGEKGLIHISEISKGYVKDVTQYLRVGERVRVKILDYDSVLNQCRLSLKALQPTTRSRHKTTRESKVPKMVIGFKTLEDIMNVSGIGEAAFNKIKDSFDSQTHIAAQPP